MSEPKLIETHLGFVCFLNEEVAEVEIDFEDEDDRFYEMPASHFHEHGIESGDDFFFEVYDDGSGKIAPRILYGPWQDHGPIRTPEQLEALEDADW